MEFLAGCFCHDEEEVCWLPDDSRRQVGCVQWSDQSKVEGLCQCEVQSAESPVVPAM